MWTIRDVAERLKVSETSVRRMIKAGDLPSIRVGGGRGLLRVTEEDLRLYVEMNRNAGVQRPTAELPARRPLKHLTAPESGG